MTTRVLFWLILFPVLLTSCTHMASTSKTLSMGQFVKNDDVSSVYTQAEALHAAGDFEAAIAALKGLVDKPYQPSHDRAYELLVEWLLQIKKTDEARALAGHFLRTHPQNKQSTDHIVQLFELSKAQTAETKTETTPSISTDPIQSQPSESETSVEQPSDLTTPSDQLIELESDVTSSLDVKKKELAQKNLADFVLFDAPIDRIFPLANQSARPSYGLANLRLARHYFHLGKLAQSLEHAQTAALHVSLESKESATSLVKEINDLMQVDPKTIGVLLPLSGPFAPFGRKTLAALSIAFDLPLDTKEQQPITSYLKEGLKIVVADSKGDSQTAAQMVATLVKQEHVALIIGDLTNEPAFFAAQKSQQFGVPMLSLSRHPLMTEIGDHIFVFNASASLHVAHLVDYALRQGHKRFAILFPKHNYGMLLAKMFYETVLNKGGVVTTIEDYDAHLNSFALPAKKLLGKFYLETRPDYVACTATKTEKICKETLKPQVDFDVLFLPDFAQKLTSLIPTLISEGLLVSHRLHDVRAYAVATKTINPHVVTLLGPNSWTGGIEKIAIKISGAYFVDSVSFEDEGVKPFAKAYLAKTGQNATPLEVFAHDAAKLAEKIVAEHHGAGVNARRVYREKITNFNGTVGLLGNLSFLKNRELNALDVGFTMDNGIIRKVASDKPNQPL